MPSKVALHSRSQDLLPEVADFQTCGDSLTKEFVVRFDLFVRGFYKDFSMFVAEAHEGLRPAGYLRDGQADIIQRLAHLKEDNRVHDVAEDLSAYRVDRPLGQRQQAEVLLACLDDTLDVRPSEVFRQQLCRGKVLVGEEHEVTVSHRQPVLLLVLHGGVFLRMVQHEIPLPLEGVVLVHIDVGIDLLAKKFDFLALPEVHVPAADEAVLALVKARAELMVERLEREALAGWHPADKGLFRADMPCMDHLLGDVSSIQDQRVDGDVKARCHVVHNGHDGTDVQHIAGDDVVPDGKAAVLVQDQHEARLDGRGLDAVAAQGIERVVVDIVRQRRGVDVTTPAEVGIGLAHLADEGLEEGHPRAVLAHLAKISRVGMQGREGDAIHDIRSEGLLHEAVAADAAPVTQDTIQDMTQNALQVRRLGEYIHGAAKANIVTNDLFKAIRHGIVRHEASLRGKEDARLAVGTEPDHLAEAFAHNLPGMELPSILDTPRLLDSGAAAEDITVVVPDQLLNPYKCHVRKFYLIVLSSTTHISFLSDTAKYFEYNFTKKSNI